MEGATLRLIASCEYADISLTSNTYKIEVNRHETQIRRFLARLGRRPCPRIRDPRGGFKEIFIGNISLKEGENVIRLIVNNAQTPAGDAGTVDAASPAVDCIKVYADAALTMTEYQNS